MDVSDFDTLDQYKEDLKAGLLKAKEDQEKQRYEQERMKKACENMSVDIPEAMIASAQERMFQNYSNQIAQQGLSMEQYLQFVGQTKEGIMEQMKDSAKAQVEQELLLEAIIKKEELEITDEELNERLNELAEVMEKDVEEIKKIYAYDDFAYLKEDLRFHKAADIVLGRA